MLRNIPPGPFPKSALLLLVRKPGSKSVVGNWQRSCRSGHNTGVMMYSPASFTFWTPSPSKCSLPVFLGTSFTLLGYKSVHHGKALRAMG